MKTKNLIIGLLTALFLFSAGELLAFRGSLVALDASTDNTIWKSYAIKELPEQVGTNAKGTPILAPSGSPI